VTNNQMVEVEILKSLWRKTQDGGWGIHDLKGLKFKPRAGFGSDFFPYESQLELMTSCPGTSSVHELFTSFGSTDFLMKQSILPVIAWVEGENFIRCIGTAFVISCTGYLITACHVLLDPQDRKYGKVVRGGNAIRFMDGMHMGVLIPINPALGYRGNLFFAFEQCWYWGEWKDSPLLHEDETFDILTDIAVCKIPLMPDGTGHQPLNLSLNCFVKDENAFAFGYAEMDDIPLEIKEGRLTIPDFEQDLYVSVGQVMDVFPDNHQRKDVPTPGPCFDFRAKVPGKMSGGPILGGDGTVVRGVISRSFSGEKHAYGAMLGPVMHLPLAEDMTLRQLMKSGNEGIAEIQGAGL
jgi:hypothetical protein